MPPSFSSTTKLQLADADFAALNQLKAEISAKTSINIILHAMSKSLPILARCENRVKLYRSSISFLKTSTCSPVNMKNPRVYKSQQPINHILHSSSSSWFRRILMALAICQLEDGTIPGEPEVVVIVDCLSARRRDRYRECRGNPHIGKSYMHKWGSSCNKKSKSLL